MGDCLFCYKNIKRGGYPNINTPINEKEFEYIFMLLWSAYIYDS